MDDLTAISAIESLEIGLLNGIPVSVVQFSVVKLIGKLVESRHGDLREWEGHWFRKAMQYLEGSAAIGVPKPASILVKALDALRMIYLSSDQRSDPGAEPDVPGQSVTYSDLLARLTVVSAVIQPQSFSLQFGEVSRDAKTAEIDKLLTQMHERGCGFGPVRVGLAKIVARLVVDRGTSINPLERSALSSALSALESDDRSTGWLKDAVTAIESVNGSQARDYRRGRSASDGNNDSSVAMLLRRAQTLMDDRK